MKSGYKTRSMPFACAALVLLIALSTRGASAADYPPPSEGIFVIRDFQFRSGERMAEVKLHYYKLGTLQKDFESMAGLTDPAIRAFSLLIALVSVGSRGHVRLRSSDPRHKPDIDPAYLSDGADLEPLVWAVRMAREFAAARPMSRLCTAELAPSQDAQSESEIREFIRSNLSTIYHPVGTCAMGGDSKLAASKLTSVVDPELRVRGIDALRVVDASVMPTVPRGW